MRTLCCLALSATVSLSFAGTTMVHVTGHVQNESQEAVVGALVSIVSAGLSAVTDAGGDFVVDLTSPVILRPTASLPAHAPAVRGALLEFTVPRTGDFVRLDILDVRGRLMGTVVHQRMDAGRYRCAPVSLARPGLAPALYVVRMQIGSRGYARSIMHMRALRNPFIVRIEQPHAAASPRAASRGLSRGLAVDQLEVAAEGYLMERVDLTTYFDSGLVITLAAATTTPQDNDYLDSLFRLLVRRVDTLGNAADADEVKSVDFVSLRDAFNAYIAAKDAYNTKANIGYMVSSVLSLNVNGSAWEIIDSINAYIDAVDSADSAQEASGLARQGVIGLGKSLAAMAPAVVMATMAQPSFPGFITLAHVQDIIQDEVLPVLDDAVRAAQRMENSDATDLTFDVDGDTVNIDRGDVYVFDAGIRLARAMLALLCIRDLDIYAPGTLDYRWVDSLRALDGTGRDFELYRVRGDTLNRVRVSDDSPTQSYMARVMKYNLERTGFTTIRRAVHAKVKSDLLAVPQLVKAAFAEIRGEAGDQAYDLIKLSDVIDADSGLYDARQNMLDQGFSPTLADNFASPEAVADFVTELLSGPYAFEEYVDGYYVNVTVNISAMLDYPVQDLRDLLPPFEWLPEEEWFTWTSEIWGTDPGGSSTLYLYPEDTLDMDASLYDSLVQDPYFADGRICYLRTAPLYRTQIDSSLSFMPIRLLDDQGDSLGWQSIDSLIDAKSFLPYFTDYTINGLFPGMTRERWLKAVYGDSLVAP